MQQHATSAAQVQLLLALLAQRQGLMQLLSLGCRVLGLLCRSRASSGSGG
jgi:hypothetical protein